MKTHSTGSSKTSSASEISEIDERQRQILRGLASKYQPPSLVYLGGSHEDSLQDN